MVELDSGTTVAQRVDIALYDTFAQSQGNGEDVGTLIGNPLVDRVVVYTWNLDAGLVEGSLHRGASAVPLQGAARRGPGVRVEGGARRGAPGLRAAACDLDRRR